METISLAISSVADLMVRYKPWPTNPADFASLVDIYLHKEYCVDG